MAEFVILGGGSKGKMPIDADEKDSESEGKEIEVSDTQETAAASVREALKGGNDKKLAKALISLIKSCEE